jgi:hypothetical protein
VARTDQPVAPPARSHGCLWSCLAAVFLFAAVGAGALYYGGWFISQGYRSDPALESAMMQVRTNPVARDVLGDNIAIESMESEMFSAATGTGKTVTYSLRLKGAKGEGRLHVVLHSAGHDMKIVSMVLTGPDDQRYNLTGAAAAPPSSSI